MNVNLHSPDVTIEEFESELTENPERLEEVTFNGCTPLIQACYHGNLKLVEWLLEQGADIEAKDNYGGTSLHWACREGREEMAALLIDYGADIEAVTNKGSTPLHVCCGGGGFFFPPSTLEARVNIAAMLIENGASLACQQAEGFSALHYLESAAHRERLLEVAAKVQAAKQCEAIAEAEEAAREETTVRESVMTPMLRWDEFSVDSVRKHLKKEREREQEREKGTSPPTIPSGAAIGGNAAGSRAIRYSNSGILSSSSSTSSLSSLKSGLKSSPSLTQLASAHGASTAALNAPTTPSATPRQSFTGLSSLGTAHGTPHIPTTTSSISQPSQLPHHAPKDHVLGRGRISTVILLDWDLPFDEKELVAVKAYPRSAFVHEDQFEAAKHEIIQEADISCQISRRSIKTDSFVRVHGVVNGTLPSAIAKLLHVEPGEECVGLVMKYCPGGSLHHLLHVCPGIHIDMVERLGLLASAARGLAELHMAGAVHCSISSRNILLNRLDGFACPRWSGFGLAVNNPLASVSYSSSDLGRERDRSSFTLTSSGNVLLPQYAVGVDLSNSFISGRQQEYTWYTAPELLGSLTGEYEDVGMSLYPHEGRAASPATTVCLPNWRTDMYSFAILCWEVLTRSRPFDGELMEGRLAVAVQGGERPPIEDILSQNQNGAVTGAVITTLMNCWSDISTDRKSAIEMYATLNQAYSMRANERFDLYISYCVETSKALVCSVYLLLTKLGYKVWLGVNDDRAEWDPLYLSKHPTQAQPVSFGPDTQKLHSLKLPASSISMDLAGHSPKSPRQGSGTPSSRKTSSEGSPGSSAIVLSANTGSNLNQAEEDKFLGGMARCDVVLAFVNSTYQSQPCCLTDTHKAKLASPPKRVVTLVTEAHPFTWASRELQQLCNLHEHMFVDLSNLAAKDWNSNEGTTTAMMLALNESLLPLYDILHQIGLRPHLSPTAESRRLATCAHKSGDSAHMNKSCSMM